MNRSELVDALELSSGTNSCTCNVAESSDNPAEHDQYCAFPLMRRAALEVRRGWRVRNWLRGQANAEAKPEAKAAFIEAHNAALAILEGRD